MNSNLYLFLLNLILCIKYIKSYPKPIDCSTNVNSYDITFHGCRERVRTDSLRISKTKFKSIFTFKGIPYAEPPVGPLRFRKSIPKVYNKPTQVDARRYGKPCMQPWVVDYPFGVMSEDCLFLNIWTPSVNSSANLPVMFWLYGGAFSIGSGSQLSAMYRSSDNIYSGSQLALRDVIIVTLNYRLGIFGFLFGNRTDCPGNQGFWDQTIALNWVKHNIRAFGGNPNDITLFGESAGSISISNHIISNVTRHLFHRVIMQSGSAYVKLMSRDKELALSIGRRFAANRRLFITGACGHSKDWIQCLRRKSAIELLGAELASILWNPSKPWYIVYFIQFSPIFGDQFVPISAPKALKDGDFKNNFKALIGHVEMEGMFFTSAFDLVQSLSGRYIPVVHQPSIISKPIVFNDIRKHFFDNDTIGTTIAHEFTHVFHDHPRRLDRNGIRRAAVHAFGDYFMTCPTILFGGHLVQNRRFNGQVYQYRLTYAHKQSFSRLSNWSNVTHTDDLALVFGSPFVDKHLWLNSDRRLSQEIMDIWTHFAKHDKLPKVNGNVWPKYDLNIDGRVNASYLELHPRSDRLGRVWTNGYNPNTIESPPSINDCFYFWDQIIAGQF